MGPRRSIQSAMAVVALALVGLLLLALPAGAAKLKVSRGATTTSRMRAMRDNSDDRRSVRHRGLKDDIFKMGKKKDNDAETTEKKGKDKDGDNNVDCFNTNNFFRTCELQRRQRRLKLPRRGELRRSLKKDKGEMQEKQDKQDKQNKAGKQDKQDKEDGDTDVPMARTGFNLEIADFGLTLGAGLNTELNNGCNCREEVERVILDYFQDVYNNAVYNFLCVAIIATSSSSSALLSETGVTVTVTFEVQNDFEATFEATSPTCSLENLVLCCLADAIPGATNAQENCANCNLANCQNPATTVDMQTFLTNQVDEDECNRDQPIFFNAVAAVPATSNPTPSPTAPLTVTASPTMSPVMGATAGPTAAPVMGATTAPTTAPVMATATADPTTAPVMATATADPTTAPVATATAIPTAEPVPSTVTSAPTASPTVAPVAATADTSSPTPGLPAETTRAPTDSPVVGSSSPPTMLPTFTNTMADTMSLSVSL